ncbi:hypothetical protein N7499_008766 [Penicillium canescens]|nr:hypothetical protein N7522_012173 [Penicillium canescens]KAJ6076785.1 hypothetical protein N7499_008766 [Penicillium canescens]KAJ6159094.1 hypothetical protein N7485_011920 [Penicillium canescens]
MVYPAVVAVGRRAVAARLRVGWRDWETVDCAASLQAMAELGKSPDGLAEDASGVYRPGWRETFLSRQFRSVVSIDCKLDTLLQ